MRLPIRRCLRRAAALALAVAIAGPELAWAAEAPVAAAAKPLDAMSPAELDHFVQGLNESANWRRYRRPGDPPDFVPGKPVRVMNGAGATFGRGGRGGGARSFRKSGLASRRGTGSRRGGNDQTSGMDRSRGSRGSSGSSFGSSSGLGSSSRSRSGSGSSRSSFGSSSGFGSSGGFGNNNNSGFNLEQ